MVLIESILCGFWGTIIVFAACELGQRFSNAFIEIDDLIGQHDWYLFPIDIQQMLPTVIINVQEAIEVKFFGSVACCREQFKKVSLLVLTCHIHSND